MLKSFFEKNRSKLPFIAFDVLAMPTAWIIVYWFKYAADGIISHLLDTDALTALSILIAGQILCYAKFKVYRGLWKFASLSDVIRVMQATVVSVILAAPLLHFISIFEVVPRRVLPLYCLILTALLCGGRLILRYWTDKRDYSFKPRETTQRVFIVGAGQAGAGLVRDLKRTQTYIPVGFIDDDKSKQGLDVHGIRVVGPLKNLPELVQNYQIDLLFIAVPSANSADMRRIVKHCELSNRPLRTLPSLQALAAGQVDVHALRKVNIDDLLGRDQIKLSWDKIAANLSGQTILVTGAGGSIGAELCRQIMMHHPKKMILLDHSEFNLYQAHQNFSQEFPDIMMETVLINIIDTVAITALFQRVKPNIVLHAAAYKHVPILEHQVRAAICNNVIGTQIVAEASVASGVEKFVLISSDKAVNPTNIMGTTKRVAEIYCQNLNNRTTTQFITVRFGNVLGSVGSVLPLFQKQLETGGPLTVTHPKMERYFMTIPEASQLILQAMVNGSGGEIFVLNMGEPVKIMYLAEQIIRLAGKTPGKDIPIKFIGLRPGEKLFEELFHASEQLVPTEHEKLFKAKFREINWEELTESMTMIHTACQNNQTQHLTLLLKKLVPEFKSESNVLPVLEETP
ncbi:MAG: polysaccharide biosynthesis protein [Gammaproteobacteria bacterium]|nr:polysaccharide biosynthesis protein [Gammaproteobacteria bacterium]